MILFRNSCTAALTKILNACHTFCTLLWPKLLFSQVPHHFSSSQLWIISFMTWAMSLTFCLFQWSKFFGPSRASNAFIEIKKLIVLYFTRIVQVSVQLGDAVWIFRCLFRGACWCILFDTVRIFNFKFSNWMFMVVRHHRRRYYKRLDWFKNRQCDPWISSKAQTKRHQSREISFGCEAVKWTEIRIVEMKI